MHISQVYRTILNRTVLPISVIEDLVSPEIQHRKLYRKPSATLSKRPEIRFQDQLSLNAGQSIAECNTFDLHKATVCH